MKKLILLIAVVGIASIAKAQSMGGPVNIPGTYLGETDGPRKNINCQASNDVCCVIWITGKAGIPNTVTVNQKTYTFTRYTTTTDDRGNSTLTFEDAQPQ